MWNTTIYLSELIGTFVLLFGVVATVHASSKTKLSGIKLRLVQGLGIGFSLAFAVYTALAFAKAGNTIGTGFVNPAVALLEAIGNDNYDLLLSSITGEIVGAIAGTLVMFGILYITSAKDERVDLISIFKVEDKKITIEGAGVNVLGEIASSAIFLGGVAATAVFGVAGPIAPLMVGMSNMIAIVILGHKFGQLFNPAAGLAMSMCAIAIGRSKIKVVLHGYLSQLVGITLIAAAIGGTYYGFANI